MSTLTGRILTGQGWVEGSIRFGQRIDEIEAGSIPPDAPIIVPGFIDLHVPGGGGGDTLAGADAVRTVARTHARHGTTSLLPSPVTAPEADLTVALTGIAAVHGERRPGEARVLGAHVEGPYLSPGKLGAQPPFARPPDAGEMDRLMALAPVRIVTMAPELPGALELIAHLAAAGVRVQLGHSLASYDETVAALDAGASGFTHLFNAMSGLDHRQPGMVAAALAHAEYAALIPDLVHVQAGAIRAALRAIPRLFCVTDAAAAAAMPDGSYPLGSHTVQKRGDSVFLADGTLAGSALTMDRALLNLLGLGLDLADAAKRLATYPADFLGLTDRGRIDAGAWADLVVLDGQNRLDAVFVEGEDVPLDAN